LGEGFGLPILEGMQFGAPTLASNNTSMPEVAGEAAILLDPLETEAWAQAMLGLASQPRKRESLRQGSQVQASRFCWKRSAASLLELYEEAQATPKRLSMRAPQMT